MAQLDPNLAAFLDVIAYSEIGPDLLAVSNQGYDVLVGSTPDHPLLFTDYSTFPDIFDRALDSTAAGRYQIIFPTWKGLCARLGLTDYSPASQDLMGASLVTVDCHAGPALETGDFTTAIALCASQWASFPAPAATDYSNRMDVLATIYQGSGGTLTG